MKIMNRTVQQARMAGLLLAAGLCLQFTLPAAEVRTQPPQNPQAPKGTTAKVIIVDRAAKAITVDIHGTIHLLWLSADAKIHKDGKDATIADITPGQTVSFVTKKTARGDVEIVLDVTIESSDTETEAAGRGKVVKSNERPGKGNGREKEGRADEGRGTPPLFAPPPVTRPAVSPHN